jgi:Superfamily II RNA helicase
VSEPSPAERFQRATSRVKTPMLTRYLDTVPFDLDPFQHSACESVEQGRGVLVAAPTGAGKTAVAEFAIFAALQDPVAKCSTRHR